MGRPNSIELKYYSLDIGFESDDKFIHANQYLLANGGTYFDCLMVTKIALRILDHIYSKGYFIKMEEDFPERLTDGIKHMGVDEEIVLRIIASLFFSEFLSKEMYDRFGILTSRGIQSRWKKAMESMRRTGKIEDKYYIRRKGETDNIKKSSVRKQKIVSSEVTTVSSEETPISSEDSKIGVSSEEMGVSSEETASNFRSNPGFFGRKGGFSFPLHSHSHLLPDCLSEQKSTDSKKENVEQESESKATPGSAPPPSSILDKKLLRPLDECKKIWLTNSQFEATRDQFCFNHKMDIRTSELKDWCEAFVTWLKGTIAFPKSLEDFSRHFGAWIKQVERDQDPKTMHLKSVKTTQLKKHGKPNNSTKPGIGAITRKSNDQFTTGF